jgi:hypothetical protein
MSRSNPSAKMRKSARYKNTPLSISIDAFGPTEVCRTLANMINDNVISSKEARKVLALSNKMTFTFRQLANIPNNNVRNLMFDLFREWTIKKVNKWELPDLFSSYFKNVIHYWYSTYLNGRRERAMLVNGKYVKFY